MAENGPGNPLFPFCPQPPTWFVEWEALLARFSWVRAMEGVPQDAVYHAEGDLLTHVRLVAASMAALPEWRDLPPLEREVLFASALLHDAAKPLCTRREGDRITSRGHARRGESLARQLLWTGEELGRPLPFAQRERIAGLVRHHGLPLRFLDEADPQRAVLAASQRARLDQVALLAEADARGRVCPEQEELLARVDLFRAYCRELRCYEGPRRFPDDHSRFLYFRGGNDPAYAAYDDTAFEVVLMAGLPGAGKDTWLRKHLAGWPVISLDALRAELRVGPEEEQGRVVQLAKERARALLRQRTPFAWNATNVTRTVRQSLVDLFVAYRARVRIVYVDAPFASILRRNELRQGGVPERVIYKLLGKLEVPDATEAHLVETVGC